VETLTALTPQEARIAHFACGVLLADTREAQLV